MAVFFNWFLMVAPCSPISITFLSLLSKILLCGDNMGHSPAHPFSAWRSLLRCSAAFSFLCLQDCFEKVDTLLYAKVSKALPYLDRYFIGIRYCKDLGLVIGCSEVIHVLCQSMGYFWCYVMFLPFGWAIVVPFSFLEEGVYYFCLLPHSKVQAFFAFLIPVGNTTSLYPSQVHIGQLEADVLLTCIVK